MVVVTIDTVLRVYNSLLNNTLSYSKADRWAWDWEYQQNLIQRGPLNFNMH